MIGFINQAQSLVSGEVKSTRSVVGMMRLGSPRVCCHGLNSDPHPRNFKTYGWTKTKTAALTGLALLLTLGTATVLINQASTRQAKQSAATAIDRVRQVNTGLPEAQTQAKMLIFSAMAQRQIPDAAHWCETLNAQGKRWPITPTNTAFAINSQLAGRAYTRKEVRFGSIHGDTVVFFETSQPGWNQSGGSELLPQNADAVAVAFANGTALIVAAAEMAKLRWTP